MTHVDAVNERLHSATFVELFTLDLENNVPTWFASTLLTACAALLVLIGIAVRRAGVPYGRHWIALSAIFIYLSIDESSSIHEHRGAPGVGDVGGVLRFQWVIPGIIAVVIVALIYRRFVLDLPRRTGMLFLAAGVIYVSGALGFELLGGWYTDRVGQDNGTYATITSFEEIIELVGLSLFVFALYRHVRETVRIRLLLVDNSDGRRRNGDVASEPTDQRRISASSM